MIIYQGLQLAWCKRLNHMAQKQGDAFIEGSKPVKPNYKYQCLACCTQPQLQSSTATIVGVNQYSWCSE